MAVIRLESLVLRGVSVLSDGRAINLRLGTSAVNEPRISEMSVISMPNPLPDYPPVFTGSAGYQKSAETTVDADATVGGAGRSHGSAGLLVSRRLAGCLSAGQRAAVIKAWHQPAGVTCPVSTRGKSMR